MTFLVLVNKRHLAQSCDAHKIVKDGSISWRARLLKASSVVNPPLPINGKKKSPGHTMRGQARSCLFLIPTGLNGKTAF